MSYLALAILFILSVGLLAFAGPRIKAAFATERYGVGVGLIVLLIVVVGLLSAIAFKYS